jgi:hypothetical protein
MLDSIPAPTVTPEVLAAIFAELPQDVAGSFLAQIQAKVASQKVDAKRRNASEAVGKVLSVMEVDLMSALPVDMELTVRHVPASKGADGKEVPARLAYTVETPGIVTMGRDKATPKGKVPGAKVCRLRLDGVNVDASSWRSALDAVNVVLKGKGREPIPVPTSSFNARVHLMGKVSKVTGLEYLGEVEAPVPAPVPAPEVKA